VINNGSVSTADPAIRDGLKWNELEMTAIHTDNKIIDRPLAKSKYYLEDQLPIIKGPSTNKTKI
jgi:hypothetical protein